jgi:glycosyltransferase involved in cell wall biosynthesis
MAKKIKKDAKVSVCITTLNEEKNIAELITSLINQTKKPDEIIIVDANSTDKTNKIIRHYQQVGNNIRLFVKKTTRSQGRNLGIKKANNNIVAITDAGCVAKKDWLKRLTQPFHNKDIDIVAGFYDMTGDTSLQKALSVFLGTVPENFDNKFLPSTRSMAMRKRAFREVGGFSQKLEDTAEDTVFNAVAISLGLKFTRVKNAGVEWGMPESIWEGIKKMYNYAKGDARSKIFIHPVPGIMSHNIKVISIILRYLFGLSILVLAAFIPILYPILILMIFSYLLLAFRKVYYLKEDFLAGLWGIPIQILSDFAVMSGFFVGLL